LRARSLSPVGERVGVIGASLSVLEDDRIVFFAFAVAHRGDGGF
jgi:hypothetical protein